MDNERQVKQIDKLTDLLTELKVRHEHRFLRSGTGVVVVGGSVWRFDKHGKFLGVKPAWETGG